MDIVGDYPRYNYRYLIYFISFNCFRYFIVDKVREFLNIFFLDTIIDTQFIQKLLFITFFVIPRIFILECELQFWALCSI